MTRKPRYHPEDNRFLGAKPRVSIMQALETAVLLMEQAGCTEEDIFRYVHMIHMGWIRDGALAPEYLELVQQVERERQAELAAEARAAAVRESVMPTTTIITTVGG